MPKNKIYQKISKKFKNSIKKKPVNFLTLPLPQTVNTVNRFLNGVILINVILHFFNVISKNVRKISQLTGRKILYSQSPGKLPLLNNRKY